MGLAMCWVMGAGAGRVDHDVNQTSRTTGSLSLSLHYRLSLSTTGCLSVQYRLSLSTTGCLSVQYRLSISLHYRMSLSLLQTLSLPTTDSVSLPTTDSVSLPTTGCLCLLQAVSAHYRLTPGQRVFIGFVCCGRRGQALYWGRPGQWTQVRDKWCCNSAVGIAESGRSRLSTARGSQPVYLACSFMSAVRRKNNWVMYEVTGDCS